MSDLRETISLEAPGWGLIQNDDYLRFQTTVSHKVTVNSYSEAIPYFSSLVPMIIFVRSDEMYMDGDKSFYTVEPGFGVALMGLDYNYAG